MKSTVLALFLSLVALHAQSAEAVPVAPLHPLQAHFALAVLFFLSMFFVAWLFFHGLFRKRVCSATPQRRRLTWAAVWTVAPFLYLLPFGLADAYLIAGFPLIPFSLLLGPNPSERLAACGEWFLAAAGWALFGLLYAAVRQRILNRRAKKAAALQTSSEPQPPKQPNVPQ